MTKISIEIWGFTFLEPMGLILNWVLAGQCYYYYLQRTKNNSTTYDRLWSAFFLCFSISTFLGGLSHFLFNYTGMQGKIPVWGAAVMAITFIELATVRQIEDKWQQHVSLLAWIKFVSTIVILIFDFHFKWVMIHTGIGLILILGTWALQAYRGGNVQARFFLWGILFSLIPLPIRLLEFDLHLWLNRDDLSHLFIMGTLYYFYEGARQWPILQRR